MLSIRYSDLLFVMERVEAEALKHLDAAVRYVSEREVAKVRHSAALYERMRRTCLEGIRSKIKT